LLATAIQAALASATPNTQSGQQVAAPEIVLSTSSSSHTLTIQWRFNVPLFPCTIPPFTVTSSVSGAATEILTGAAYDDGSGFAVPNCTVTAAGNVNFNQVGTWIKAKVTAYSAGTLSVVVAACIP